MELDESAKIDGASPLRALRSIVLPISRPILGVVTIFGFVAVWKDFLWPLLVESGYTPTRETINVGITGATTTIPITAASRIRAIPVPLNGGRPQVPV